MTDIEIYSLDNRLPLSSPEDFCEWLLNGLDGFYKNFDQNGLGDTRAFPGYTFSNSEDIPPQFPDLFKYLDDESRQVVRDGIAFAFQNRRERLLRSPNTLCELVQIGLKINPVPTATSANVYLPFLRQRIENGVAGSEQRSCCDAYLRIMMELLAPVRAELGLWPALEQEYQSLLAKPSIPEVMPVLKKFVESNQPKT